MVGLIGNEASNQIRAPNNLGSALVEKYVIFHFMPIAINVLHFVVFFIYCNVLLFKFLL